MQRLKSKVYWPRRTHDKTSIQRQIDATDRQIDRLVYELYELTEEAGNMTVPRLHIDNINIGTWTENYRLVYARYGLTDGENAVVEGTDRSISS